MSESESSSLKITRLVSFLVTATVRNNQEWEEWGVDFIRLIVESQFESDQVEGIYSDLVRNLCPIIDHSVVLFFEESRGSGLSDYTFIHEGKTYFSQLMTELEQDADLDFESFVNTFFKKFLAHLMQIDQYDARSRFIARKTCEALHLTAEAFTRNETDRWTHHLQSSDSEQTRDFLQSFNEEASAVPTVSLVASFRLWRVALIAATGGAVMAVAGAVAAASIVETVLPLLYLTTSFSEVSASLGALLTAYGVTAETVVLPSVLGSYGATVAAQRMLHRTAPLAQFQLLPLQYSVVEAEAADMSTAGFGIVVEVGSAEEQKGMCAEDKRITVDQSVTASGNSDTGNEPTVINPSPCDPSPSKEQSKELSREQSEGSRGASVFLLVSGHSEPGVDPKQVWGADGTVPLVGQHGFNSLFEDFVERAAGDLGIPLNYLTPLMKITEKEVATITKDINPAEKPETHLLNPPENPATPTTTTTTTTVEVSVAVGSCDSVSILSSAVASRDAGVKACLETEAETESSGLNDFLEWEKIDSSSIGSGWWREMMPLGDEYLLQWEPEVLKELNQSLHRLIADNLAGQLRGKIMSQLWKLTPIYAIQSAFGLPLRVLGKMKELDDPWLIAMDRARQAGKLLAHILLKQHQTENETEKTENETESVKKRGGRVRPVSLVGYGMGARLIFHCLEALAEHYNNNKYNKHSRNREKKEGRVGWDVRAIVENAVLIGGPVNSSANRWANIRSVVAGRLINCYSKNDWILALLYRCRSYDVTVAGISPVVLPSSSLSSSSTSVKASVGSETDKRGSEVWGTVGEGKGKGVENIDVSHLVQCHADYPVQLPEILRLVQLA